MAGDAVAKKIGRSDIIGERGIAFIRQVALAMGYMFYETGGVEAGIDGYIEIRDTETGAVSNILLQVQGKATESSRLPAETAERFEWPCNPADIAYWMQGTAPVLLIVVKLEDEKAYWKPIKQWFADPEHLASKKVVFDKASDVFALPAKAAITAVALSAVPGASGPSVRRNEELLSNLLGIRIAKRVFWAPSDYRTDKAFGLALRKEDRFAPSEWIVRGDAILSFHDLSLPPWNDLCESGAMEEFDIDDWAESDDPDRQRDFVALLNRAIGEFVRPDLFRDKDSGAFYFRKVSGKDDVNYVYRSLQKTTTRRVVGPYGKRKDAPTLPAYFRHSAFMHRFVRLGDKWYLEVSPSYHFTRDGLETDAFAGEHLKKIKELENNAAVMGQFVMWQAFLTTRRAGDLLSPAYPFLSFVALPSLELDVGVPDELWKSQEANPASPLFDYAVEDEDLRE